MATKWVALPPVITALAAEKLVKLPSVAYTFAIRLSAPAVVMPIAPPVINALPVLKSVATSTANDGIDTPVKDPPVMTALAVLNLAKRASVVTSTVATIKFPTFT